MQFSTASNCMALNCIALRVGSSRGSASVTRALGRPVHRPRLRARHWYDIAAAQRSYSRIATSCGAVGLPPACLHARIGWRSARQRRGSTAAIESRLLLCLHCRSGAGARALAPRARRRHAVTVGPHAETAYFRPCGHLRTCLRRPRTHHYTHKRTHTSAHTQAHRNTTHDGGLWAADHVPAQARVRVQQRTA